MKHTFFTSAVLFVICVGSLSAQDSLKVRSFVSRKFEREFAGATNIEWSKARRLFVAIFDYHNEVWLAFYNEHGEMLASGRRLGNIRQLPLNVQLSISNTRRRIERKYGPFVTSFALEMVSDDNTNYYVPMENGTTAIMLCADNEGEVSISRKDFKFRDGFITPALLARNN